MKLSEKTAAQISQIPALLTAGSRALITVHQDPDMDAVGSALAWASFLTQYGLNVDIWAADPLEDYLLWLPGVRRVEQSIPNTGYDTVWVLDAASFERVRRSQDIRLVAPNATIVNIDHHADNTLFGDLIVVQRMSSVGEFLVHIIRALGGQITLDMAICLYSAICYDTGRFLYSNTTSTTLRVAADLVDCGLELGPLGVQLYESTPSSEFRILQIALQNLVVAPDIGLVYTVLPSDGVESGVKVIDFIRQFKEAQVVAVFKAQLGGSVRVNLRSKCQIEVNKVAHEFGGGGHPKAAGIIIRGDMESVVADVTHALRRAIQHA